MESQIWWGVALVVAAGLIGYGGHAVMRRKAAFGQWRYRLRRTLHLREDETDMAVKKWGES